MCGEGWRQTRQTSWCRSCHGLRTFHQRRYVYMQTPVYTGTPVKVTGYQQRHVAATRGVLGTDARGA